MNSFGQLIHTFLSWLGAVGSEMVCTIFRVDLENGRKDVGRDLAWDAGISLANPDPDGPPIGALAWPGLFYITSQRPAAGTIVYRWDSVAVEVVAHGDAESNAWQKRPGAPPAGSAHVTTPQPEQRVDLTETDPPIE